MKSDGLRVCRVNLPHSDKAKEFLSPALRTYLSNKECDKLSTRVVIQQAVVLLSDGWAQSEREQLLC